MKVYIINEHPEWLAPLGRELESAGVPWAEWYTDQGSIDLEAEPPEGVYFNRMSPSSHTRGHRHSVTHTRELLAWLEARGRTVFNGSRALELEISKARQAVALRSAGIRTPRTVAVVGGREAVFDAARGFPVPFLVKPARGGRGLGVRLITSLKQLVNYLSSPDFESPPEDAFLLQEYIRSSEPFVTRVEFVGGEFVYAIRARTTDGFELCPADACSPCDPNAKFALRRNFDDPIIDRYRSFLRTNGIAVCGLEFIEDEHGNKYTYDVNSTTNYNAAIESQVPVSANRKLAEFLGAALRREKDATRLRDRLPASRLHQAETRVKAWSDSREESPSRFIEPAVVRESGAA